MLGERDRVRDVVGWDLGESTTTPSFNNNNNYGGQQTSWACGIGEGDSSESNKIGGITTTGPPHTQHNYSHDEDDDDYDATNIYFGEASGDILPNGGGGFGKEVRYAPLPLTQSPTHSNPTNQAPLQRAHSR